MKLGRLWRAGVITAVVGVVSVVASACAAGQTVTITPPAVTVTPQAAKTLILQTDVVIGTTGIKNPADACVQSSRFQQGEQVVWRIKVYDPATGQPMTDKALTSVIVSLKDGQTFKAAYGGHPGGPTATPTDSFWSAGWSIPATYPTGSLPYQVAATSNDGRTGTFTQFNVAPSLLTIVAAQ